MFMKIKRVEFKMLVDYLKYAGYYRRLTGIESDYINKVLDITTDNMNEFIDDSKYAKELNIDNGYKECMKLALFGVFGRLYILGELKYTDGLYGMEYVHREDAGTIESCLDDSYYLLDNMDNPIYHLTSSWNKNIDKMIKKIWDETYMSDLETIDCLIDIAHMLDNIIKETR